MRPVTLLSVALAGLLWAAAPAGAAPPADGPQSQPAAVPAPQASPAARPQAPGARAPEQRRRRTSYASCNRESHRRKLSGGARRRFLVRCRLGYERRPAGQTAPARRP